MKYYTLTTPEGEDLPNPFAANDASEIGLVRDLGYTWVETEAPAPDPAAKLAADMAFGEGLIKRFVEDGRASQMPAEVADLLDDYLNLVERRLWRGSILDARRELARLEPKPWFPEGVQNEYLRQIDAYLSS